MSPHEQYVPGLLKCPQCGFELHKSLLHAQTGNVSVDTRLAPVEPCPNDGTILETVTWKEHCEDIAKVCEGQIKRAVEAEDALLKLLDETRLDKPVNINRLLEVRREAAKLVKPA